MHKFKNINFKNELHMVSEDTYFDDPLTTHINIKHLLYLLKTDSELYFKSLSYFHFFTNSCPRLCSSLYFPYLSVASFAK